MTVRPRQEEQRGPRQQAGFFSMLVTGGLVGLALAALRSLSQSGREVTLEGYARLEPGMSYDQVCETLGRRGDDITVSAGSKLFAWKNRDGSRLAALFRDGRLACYGAHGLR